MDLVEVDVIGAEPAQAGLDGLAYVAPRGARAPVGTVASLHVHAELGGYDHVAATAPQRPAQQLFARPRAIGVGGVEEGDPCIECGVDDGPGLVGVDPGAEGVAAEADDGDHQAAAAQWAEAHLAHVSSPAAAGRRSRSRAPRPRPLLAGRSRARAGCFPGRTRSPALGSSARAAHRRGPHRQSR